MGKIFEATGKTVEEAIDAACAAAGVSVIEDNYDMQVIDLGNKGFLGFGGKEAKVRITLEDLSDDLKKEDAKKEDFKKAYRPQKEIKKSPLPNIPHKFATNKASVKEADLAALKDGENSSGIELDSQIKEDALFFLKPIFKKMQVSPTHKMEIKEGMVYLSFYGHNLGSLIGRRGETLNALQYLVNLAINQNRPEHIRILLDVEGYRKSREETLEALARKMADKAVRSGQRVRLEPMNPHERRIVHMALQEDHRVDTISQGEEPYRRVIISKKNHGSTNRGHGSYRQ